MPLVRNNMEHERTTNILCNIIIYIRIIILFIIYHIVLWGIRLLRPAHLRPRHVFFVITHKSVNRMCVYRRPLYDVRNKYTARIHAHQTD